MNRFLSSYYGPDKGKKSQVEYANIPGCTPEILSNIKAILKIVQKILYGGNGYNSSIDRYSFVINESMLRQIEASKGLNYRYLNWIIEEGYYELIYFFLPTLRQNNTPEISNFIRTYVQCICSIYSQIDSPLIYELEKQKILKRLINQDKRQELEEKFSSPTVYSQGQKYICYYLKQHVFEVILKDILRTLANNLDRDLCEDVIQSISFVDNDSLIEYCLKWTQRPEYFLDDRFSKKIQDAAKIKIGFYNEIKSLPHEYVEMFRELCKHQIERLLYVRDIAPIDKMTTCAIKCMLITPIINERQVGECPTLEVPEVLRDGIEGQMPYAYYTLLALINGKIRLNPTYCGGRLAEIFFPIISNEKGKVVGK